MDAAREMDHDAMLALLDDWYEGRIDELEAYRLKELLRTDLRAQQLYVEYADLRSSLALDSFDRDDPDFHALVAREGRGQLPAWVWAIGSVVAAALILLGVFIGFRLSAARETAEIPLEVESIAAVEPPPTQAAAVPDGAAAVVIELVGSGAATDRARLELGAEIEYGEEVDVDQFGSIRLELPNGVQLLLQGRAVMAFHSPMAVELLAGRVLGRVPPAARGFYVAVPGGGIRDLGTSFAAATSEMQQSLVTVLEGEVALELTRGDGPPRTLSLAAGASGRLAPATGGLEGLPARPAELDYIIAFDAGIERISDSGRFYARLPPPLWTADRHRIDAIQIYKEGVGVLLAEPLRLDSVDGLAETTLPAGTRLDTFLVRFDPADTVLLDAVISFRQPILGVIVSSELLSASDPAFAAPEIAAGWLEQTKLWHERRSANEEGDSVRVENDGRSLAVSLRTARVEYGFDELRVLTLPAAIHEGRSDVPPSNGTLEEEQ